MPSGVITEEDLEDALVSAGIRSPLVRQRLLRLIKQYAMRKYPPAVLPLEEEDLSPEERYEYKCPVCKQRFFLEGFPESKAENRRRPVPCLLCEAFAEKAASLTEP